MPMRIPKLLEPLRKLQIILHLAFRQLVHGDGLVNTVFLECGLEDFVVVQVFVFLACTELDTGHREVACSGDIPSTLTIGNRDRSKGQKPYQRWNR